ncbi:hypothetical protein BT63DRAFT_456499 [Microthyrium microscopicum]|uniref:Uncharacterized protein n=1 Tax=Microthyrium microscopicum TaxID=703497 RepID=A0A6A6U9A7_9PEZI|nr:hypothetical protein BT63DRAFT_456499 [Microthyrium microscopicum]
MSLASSMSFSSSSYHPPPLNDYEQPNLPQDRHDWGPSTPPQARRSPVSRSFETGPSSRYAEAGPSRDPYYVEPGPSSHFPHHDAGPYNRPDYTEAGPSNYIQHAEAGPSNREGHENNSSQNDTWTNPNRPWDPPTTNPVEHLAEAFRSNVWVDPSYYHSHDDNITFEELAERGPANFMIRNFVPYTDPSQIAENFEQTFYNLQDHNANVAEFVAQYAAEHNLPVPEAPDGAAGVPNMDGIDDIADWYRELPQGPAPSPAQQSPGDTAPVRSRRAALTTQAATMSALAHIENGALHVAGNANIIYRLAGNVRRWARTAQLSGFRGEPMRAFLRSVGVLAEFVEEFRTMERGMEDAVLDLGELAISPLFEE